MCGDDPDHYIDTDEMALEDLCTYFRNNMHTMFSFKAHRYISHSQYQMYLAARKRYFLILNELKIRIKDVSLEYLIKLSNENDALLGIMDPDNISESDETISDVAKKEIHRRTFQRFTMVPRNKDRIDATYIGYPRKPTF